MDRVKEDVLVGVPTQPCGEATTEVAGLEHPCPAAPSLSVLKTCSEISKS
jgi:hypothetical protein